MQQVEIIEVLKGVAAHYEPAEQAARRADRVNRISHKFCLMLDACEQKDISQIELLDIGGGGALISTGAAGLKMKRAAVVDDYGDPEAVTDEYDFLAAHKKLGVEIYSQDAIKDGIMNIPGQFDIICSFDSMEHWHNSPKKMFGHVMQKLKPGGLLFLNAPNCVSLRKRITVPLGRGAWSGMNEWYEHETFRGHVREPDVATMKYIARDLNLQNVRILGRNFIVYNRLKMKSTIWPKIDPLKVFPSLCSDLFLLGHKPK